MSAWNPKANDIFLQALDVDAPDERRRFTDEACGGDAELRAQVESLIVAGDRAGSFLECPAVDFGAGDSPGDTLALPLREGPGTVIGRYKLLERIGEGGFGVVFMAEQQHPVRRKVALKVIKPGLDTRQVVARFEAERQALAMMDHPNIAKVLDAGATGAGRPYFVMDLVHGVPITEFCDKNQLPPRERLELFVQVCRAVQHAHTKGIIHRDIKPTNVLVTLHEGVAVPKVIDFGVAKATGQQLTDKTLFTSFQQMVGTPLYMSPEQAEMTGIDVDTRSDVYSLGVLLYELLTGTTPVDKDRLNQAAFDEVRRIIREEEPQRPSTRLSTMGEQARRSICAQRKSDPKRLGRFVRGELDWIVMKALEKDRARRYETAAALGADVQRHLVDEPVLARPAGAVYRLRKLARRYKAGAAAAAAVFLALACGMGLATYGLVKAEAALASAERQRLAAESNARRATVANDFLNKMLHAVNPYHGLGDVSVRQVLDRAAGELDRGRLSSHPDAEAAARVTVGRSYASLGLEEAAERQLHAAVTLLRTQSDARAGSVDLAIALTALGGMRHGQREVAAAGVLFKEALTTLDTLPPLGDVDRRAEARAEALVQLGWLTYWYDDNPPAAERLAREALEVIRARSGAGTPSPAYAINASNLLAHIHIDRKEFVEAEALCRETLRLARASPDDQQSPMATGWALSAFGRLRLSDGGDAAEAVRAYREALEVTRRAVGEAHRDTLWVVGQLSHALIKSGDHEGAERLLLDQNARLEALPGVPAVQRVDLLRTIVHFYKQNKGERNEERVAAWAPKLRALSLAMLDEQLDTKTRLLVGRGDDARLLASRGLLNGRRGRFQEAAADLRRATALYPAEHWSWYHYGCLVAYLGNAEAHRQVAGEMLARFEGSPSVVVNERTAKTSLLLPHVGQDVSRLGRMVDAALATPPQASVISCSVTPWLHLCKALAEYRAGEGHYEGAVRHLKLSRQGITDGAGAVTIDLLNAMCLHRLERAAEARAAYDEACRAFDREVIRVGESDLGEGGLENWLVVQVIRREADALFSGR